MPKVTQDYIEKKKEAIIEAAYSLCIKKTVSTVTMQDIINETGLSQGGIYRFYKDIDDIFSDMIFKKRNSMSIKGEIDRIIDNESLTSKEVANQLFEMLGDFMENNLMTVLKIDFELSVLAMNNPRRVDKIIKNISGIGNMEYLSVRAMEYFKCQKEKGLIKPRVDEKELLSYISSAYSGIQMQCIVANCYKYINNPLNEYYSPKTQLKLLAKTVNYLLGEEA